MEFIPINRVGTKKKLKAIESAMSKGYGVALNKGTNLNEGHCVVMHSIVKRTYESVRGKVYSKMFYNIMDPATGTYKSISKYAIHNSNIIIHWR